MKRLFGNLLSSPHLDSIKIVAIAVLAVYIAPILNQFTPLTWDSLLGTLAAIPIIAYAVIKKRMRTALFTIYCLVLYVCLRNGEGRTINLNFSYLLSQIGSIIVGIIFAAYLWIVTISIVGFQGENQERRIQRRKYLLPALLLIFLARGVVFAI